MAVHETKLRILYVMQILQEYTDEEHTLNASQLCRILKRQYGITADRRTIYSEIDILKAYGADIVQLKGKTPGYYIGNRQFEFPELKLLVDAVQASKFITEKKSKDLIAKLQKLCSKAEAEQLARQVVICNRPKTGNEKIYYNVDQIHSAIYRNLQITFQYVEWTPKKELRLKKNGDFYVVSPCSLTWDDENYYLIAYDEQSEKVKHYRVDKMQHMRILTKGSRKVSGLDQFDLASFTKKTFGMYGGSDAEVTLLCRNDLAGVVIDRFGKNIRMTPINETTFQAKVVVSVSPQFFGWLTGIGSHMKIEAPETVKKEYEQYLSDILAEYD